MLMHVISSYSDLKVRFVRYEANYSTDVDRGKIVGI